MKRAGHTAPVWRSRSQKWGKGAIHGEFSMTMSIHFLTALPSHCWQRDVASFQGFAWSL